MRQRTHWDFIAVTKDKTYMRVGRVFNPGWSVKKDVIRLQIRSVSDFIDMHMKRSEALAIAAGLTKTLTRDVYLREKEDFDD